METNQTGGKSRTLKRVLSPGSRGKRLPFGVITLQCHYSYLMFVMHFPSSECFTGTYSSLQHLREEQRTFFVQWEVSGGGLHQPTRLKDLPKAAKRISVRIGSSGLLVPTP